MSVQQVENVNLIQSRVTNPFGAVNEEFLNEYSANSTVATIANQEEQYKNISKAEASYVTASINLGNSNIIKQFNMLAKMNGYGNVNTLHRHDIG